MGRRFWEIILKLSELFLLNHTGIFSNRYGTIFIDPSLAAFFLQVATANLFL